MTLAHELEQRLAAMPLFTGLDELLEIDQGTRQLRCQLVALDSLACSFTRLSVRADTLVGKSWDQLKKTAEQLAARLTYLLEPISPIEMDAHGCTVQMRSNPPQKDQDRTTYYELIVAHSGELSLVRYARTAGQARQVVPAQLTREVLARLVTDFAAATD